MLTFYIIGIIIILLGISVAFGAPYVPSHKKDIQWLFDDFVPIGEGDCVLDLGSGDGLVLREVSRRGARAVGYEIHPLFIGIAKILSWGDPHVRVRLANAWTTPFPEDVTLVYAFTVARDGRRLARTMQREATRLGRPLRLVSYGNDLPDVTPTMHDMAYHVYVFEPLHP